MGLRLTSHYDGWPTNVCVVPHIRRLKSEFSVANLLLRGDCGQGKRLTRELPLKPCDWQGQFRMTSGPSRPNFRPREAVGRQFKAIPGRKVSPNPMHRWSQL